MGRAGPGTPASHRGVSPTRLLEMLPDRFGAFEAIANSGIKLARVAPQEELGMDVLVAEAVLDIADDLRVDYGTQTMWIVRRGPVLVSTTFPSSTRSLRPSPAVHRSATMSQCVSIHCATDVCHVSSGSSTSVAP